MSRLLKWGGIACNAASEYIHLHRGDKDKLVESLEIVARTATDIIPAIMRAPAGDVDHPTSTVPPNDRLLDNCHPE